MAAAPPSDEAALPAAVEALDLDDAPDSLPRRGAFRGGPGARGRPANFGSRLPPHFLMPDERKKKREENEKKNEEKKEEKEKGGKNKSKKEKQD